MFDPLQFLTEKMENHLPNLSERVTKSQLSATVGIADELSRLRENNEKVFDFSAGRATENTPAYIIKASIHAMQSGATHQTMAKGTTSYRKACAAKLARENSIIANPDSEIVATMGIKQGMTNTLLALLNPGDEVIVEDPCFVSYHQLISYCGGKSIAVPIRHEHNFRWETDALEAAITSNTKAILINSPQNPTGTVHTKEDLEKIVDIAIRHNLYVISDEVYERVTWDGRSHYNIARLPGMKERTITLMSLTKSFAMGGWRTGFVYASTPIISQMVKLQQHLITSCNAFVQAGSAVAFGEPPKQEVVDLWKSWEEKCAFATTFLDQVDGLSVQMPEGGYYAWTDISQLGISSQVFAERLLKEHKVGVIPGRSFGAMGENYVRVTCVRSWDELKEGLERIKKFVVNLK